MGIVHSGIDVTSKPKLEIVPKAQVVYGVQPCVPPKTVVGSWALAPGTALPQGLPLKVIANPTFGGAPPAGQTPPPPPGPPPPQPTLGSAQGGAW